MKYIFRIIILLFSVTCFQQALKADRDLKITSPYKDEEVFIDYNFIFSPADMDGLWEGTFGPHYSQYDLAARNEEPSVVIKMLEDRYQTLIKNSNYVTKDIVKILFPTYSYGVFTLTSTSIRYSGNYGIGGIFNDRTYLGNPLTTAASHGKLDVVKAIVEWIKQKLQSHNALHKLNEALNAPAINFGVKKTKGCMIIGTALIFALLNEGYAIVQYLLDQGAFPEGAFVEKGLFTDMNGKFAKIICSRDGSVFSEEDILIDKLLLDAEKRGKLKLAKKLKDALEKAEYLRTKQLAQEEREKIEKNIKEQQERLAYETFLIEQGTLDRNYRLQSLETALNTPKEILLSQAQKDLLHDAGKAVWKYPELFENVLKKRPDLADIIEERAIEFAGAQSNYAQTPIEKRRELATEVHNKLAAIRKQFGAPEGPNLVLP